MATKKQSPPLSERQKRFAEAFARNGGNTEQAALEAGYSKTYARKDAHKLRANTGIAEYLNTLTAKIREQGIKNAIDRQRLWSEIAWDDAQNTSDRLRASELLGKSQGDFIERVSGDIRLRIVEDDG